jgi:hypothetical protein
MAAFQEVFRRSGIDERRSPPGMVVPFGGANIVALIDPGRKLKVDPNAHALEIKEIDGAEIRKRVMQVRDTFEPNVDEQLRAASLPAIVNGDARFFEIKGRKKPIGFPGLEVVFRSADRKFEAKLHVAVLPEIKIKVAFRNVMVRGSGSGAPAFHATTPCNEQDELLTMNNIWRPQANIRFERVPSDWLVIDDSQDVVKKELADATGMKDASLATFPDMIDVGKLKGFFFKHKVRGAHLTIFCVDKLWSNGSSPNGSFARGMDMAFISSQRGPNTSAHEAGHFLGYYSKSVTKPWDSLGHTLEKDAKGNEDRAEDLKMLMRAGGGGWKIPFNLVKEFRDFPG